MSIAHSISSFYGFGVEGGGGQRVEGKSGVEVQGGKPPEDHGF